MNVSQFLDKQGARYEVIRHEPTYDAQHLAQGVGEPGRNVAKTVLLRRGADYVVAVLPATRNIDLERARQVLGSSEVELATEIEMKRECKDCEIGALPPFGTHYGMQTIVDAALTRAKDIVFEANRHDEAIRMRFSDFEMLERPRIAEFAKAPA